MNKKVKKVAVASVLMSFIGMTATTNVANAYPVDECSIWLCLPVGFSVSGCGSAKSIFMKKLRKGKNPIPSWSKCAVAPKHSEETQKDAQKFGVELDFSKPKQPYTSSFANTLYIKGENQKIVESKLIGIGNGRACDKNGYGTTTKEYWYSRGGRDYYVVETWTAYACNVSWTVNTFTTNPAYPDLNTVFRDHKWGMKYEQLEKHKFVPKLLNTKTRSYSSK